jgi:hypothetical protein
MPFRLKIVRWFPRFTAVGVVNASTIAGPAEQESGADWSPAAFTADFIDDDRNQSAFLAQEPVPEAFINWDSVHSCVECLNP